MSTNPLVPSFRFPAALPAEAAHPLVRAAIENNTNQLVDVNQAIVAMKAQVETLKAGTSTTTVNETVTGGSSTTAGVSSFNGATGAVTYFPDLGIVNNQTGQIAYTTQSQDSGAIIILDDTSPIAIGLNYAVGAPWYAFFANYGTGTATLTPSNIPSGATSTISYASNLAASSMPILGGYWAGVWFDGVNFWAAVLPIVPVTKTAFIHQFLVSYDATTGIFVSAQPLFTDISGTAAVTQGGTGATTAAGARTNLGAAASGVNSDITSLTGLTTPLPVSEGGTGTTTPSLVPGTNVTITGTWPNQTVNASTTGLSVTITTAALTTLGTQGSMTFTAGLLTSQTPAT